MNAKDRLGNKCPVPFPTKRPKGCFAEKVPDTYFPLIAKLGWLRGFRDDIPRWNRCHDIVSRSLTVINEEELYRGSAENLKSALSFFSGCTVSDALMNKLTSFVEESEQQLPAGIRAPLSTEILASRSSIAGVLRRFVTSQLQQSPIQRTNHIRKPQPTLRQQPTIQHHCCK